VPFQRPSLPASTRWRRTGPLVPACVAPRASCLSPSRRRARRAAPATGLTEFPGGHVALITQSRSRFAEVARADAGGVATSGRRHGLADAVRPTLPPPNRSGPECERLVADLYVAAIRPVPSPTAPRENDVLAFCVTPAPKTPRPARALLLPVAVLHRLASTPPARRRLTAPSAQGPCPGGRGPMCRPPHHRHRRPGWTLIRPPPDVHQRPLHCDATSAAAIDGKNAYYNARPATPPPTVQYWFVGERRSPRPAPARHRPTSARHADVPPSAPGAPQSHRSPPTASRSADAADGGHHPVPPTTSSAAVRFVAPAAPPPATCHRAHPGHQVPYRSGARTAGAIPTAQSDR